MNDRKGHDRGVLNTLASRMGTARRSSSPRGGGSHQQHRSWPFFLVQGALSMALLVIVIVNMQSPAPVAPHTLSGWSVKDAMTREEQQQQQQQPPPPPLGESNRLRGGNGEHPHPPPSGSQDKQPVAERLAHPPEQETAAKASISSAAQNEQRQPARVKDEASSKKVNGPPVDADPSSSSAVADTMATESNPDVGHGQEVKPAARDDKPKEDGASRSETEKRAADNNVEPALNPSSAEKKPQEQVESDEKPAEHEASPGGSKPVDEENDPTAGGEKPAQGEASSNENKPADEKNDKPASDSPPVEKNPVQVATGNEKPAEGEVSSETTGNTTQPEINTTSSAGIVQVKTAGGNRTEEILSIFQQPAPWRQSKVIPRWMKDYMQWHRDQRAAMTADNWNNGTFRFLVVRCSAQDPKCGGTADRLKPLPFYFLLANHFKRILCIWWEKPAPLEEFLVHPSVDGIDLSMPQILLERNESIQRLRLGTPDLFGAKHVQGAINYKDPQSKAYPVQTRKTNKILEFENVVTIRFQTHEHGRNEYNNMRVQYPYIDPETNQTVQPINLAKTDDEVEASYEEIFRDVWYSCFVPVPAIQHRIAEQMNKLGLYRNQYMAIHIRSRYHNEARGPRLRNLCRNAVHCIYQLDPQKASTRPIYVSADHRSAVWSTLQYSRELSLHRVTARDKDFVLSLSRKDAIEDHTGVLHLDRGSNHLAQNPKDFTTDQFESEQYYDTFVDLYILSQADCIAFNVGNYGKWANLLSDNFECRISHMSYRCPTSHMGIPGI